MVKNKLHKSTKRNLLQLKHYKFRTKLMSKCEIFPNTEIKVCTEEYTSKTCTCCGNMK